MNVLVVGSGGREHALCWKIRQSPLVEQLYCAPGNAGIAREAKCVDIAASDTAGLIAFAKDNRIGLTVVGPEDPLAQGIVDAFDSAGLQAFGPSAAAAQLEASKRFAKEVMTAAGIPTAAYRAFRDPESAKAYVRERGAPIVIKADGLAAGKGVTVARDVAQALEAIDDAMSRRAFGDAGSEIVIEECLVGEEASIFALSDGANYVMLASSQDHKRAFDGDEGPNTGGMGAYSPAPIVTPELMQRIEREIIGPCIRHLSYSGIPYRGVLYAGLMIGADGPKVVEFNCRFGDPETQVVLPRMKSDLVPLLIACCEGGLAERAVEWHDAACTTVVMASGGYPGAYAKGKTITGLEEAARDPEVVVFHAGTKAANDQIQTNGGRVLNVTATGGDIAASIDRAYAAVRCIRFEGAHYRTDIGRRALG